MAEEGLYYRDATGNRLISALFGTLSAAILKDVALLTHLPLDKMAAIWADHIFKCIVFNEKVWIFIKISLKFAPKGLIDNNQALV